jgi:HD-like signal output (HDOD) protein
VYLARKKDVRHIGEELWSAALLHDLGKLVYVKFFPEHFVALKTHMEENGCSCSTAETERDFPATAYLGTLLCDHWRLPLSVRAACEAHTLETLYEAEVSISLSETTRLVCVANLLSSLSMDTLNDDFKTEFGEAVKKALNYDEVRFANLMVEVEGLKADVDLFIRQFS